MAKIYIDFVSVNSDTFAVMKFYEGSILAEPLLELSLQYANAISNLLSTDIQASILHYNKMTKAQLLELKEQYAQAVLTAKLEAKRADQAKYVQRIGGKIA